MTQVFNPYSRFTAPVQAVEDLIEDQNIALPDGIGDITIARVNGKLHIESTSDDDSFGRYTPTAIIKAGLSDKTIVVEDDGTITHETVSAYKKDLGWTARDEEDIDTTTVTYADFYGRDDEIIVHKALRAEMFDVLCKLTTVAVRGHVNGILLEDDELQPVWYDAGGDTCDVELDVKKTSEQAREETGSDDSGNAPVNWSQKS